jgi:pimeloyl-ACP methyl ester carboxylesterase
VVAFCVTARTASPDAWLARAARVREQGIGAIRDLVLERWGYVGHRPDLAQWIVAQLLATSDEGYAATCEAMAYLDLESDLGSVRAPTLIVAGADDPSAPPAAGEAIAAAIPGGQVHTVAGSAHLLNREQPRAATRLITEHVLRTRAASLAGDR